MGRLDSQPDYQEAPEAVIPFATAKNQNKTPQKAKIKHSKKQKIKYHKNPQSFGDFVYLSYLCAQ
jgi:hypothetical protein